MSMNPWRAVRGRRAGAAIVFAAALAGVTAPVPAAQSVEPDVPPTGASLFDQLFSQVVDGRAHYRIPFPFEELTREIAGHLDSPDGAAGGIAKVLIPVGRSLQRDAARPHYFEYPRAVAAVVGTVPESDGSSRPQLRDRLFLGYQEKAEILEVISYNETAGRFEYQIVNDYGADRRPRVSYAKRRVCLGCHQNGALIWSQPVWDETNANENVALGIGAARQMRTDGRLYGIPIRVPPAVPLAIASSIERANRFSVTQRIWRELCGIGRDNSVKAAHCRARLLTLALQSRLNTLGRFDRHSKAYSGGLERLIETVWPKLWPVGLKVPEPFIPNRSPDPASPGVGADVDPLNLRLPRETWTPETPGLVSNIIDGIAGQFSKVQIRRLDEHLYGRATALAPVLELAASCRIEGRDMAGWAYRVQFFCDPASDGEDRRGSTAASVNGRLFLKEGRIDGGYVERVEVDGEAVLMELKVTTGRLRMKDDYWLAELDVRNKVNGRHGRMPDGRAVGRITVTWTTPESWPLKWPLAPADMSVAGNVRIPVVDDFSILTGALERMIMATAEGHDDALSGKPLRPSVIAASLFRELGMTAPVVMGGLPPHASLAEKSENVADSRLPPGLPSQFTRFCAPCHDTPEPFPPNFLFGPEARVVAALGRCAERIYYRLGMWSIPAATRPKSPMPPASALEFLGIDPDHWRESGDLETLSRFAGALAVARTPKLFDADALLGRPYADALACTIATP